MKIYTKTGDRGETSLLYGKRVSKTDPRITAIGEIDELNSIIGVALCYVEDSDANDLSAPETPTVKEVFVNVQKMLFVAGAELAASDASKAVKKISDKDIEQLEKWIDTFSEQLEPLKNFILPGGGHTDKCRAAAYMHLARTVCRRAERTMAALHKEGACSARPLTFLNRLSDLLFTLARVL